MDIVFIFQGEEVYRISLPKQTISASFEVGIPSETYKNLHISIPSITNIQLQNTTKEKIGD